MRLTEKQWNTLLVIHQAGSNGIDGQAVARRLREFEERPVYYDAAHSRLVGLERRGLVRRHGRVEHGIGRGLWFMTHDGYSAWEEQA